VPPPAPVVDAGATAETPPEPTEPTEPETPPTTVATPTPTPPPADSAGGCRGRFDSLPPGVPLRVNGRDVGVGPVDLVDLPCDTPITVEATQEKWEPFRRSVTFTADKPGRYVASLRRPQVALSITSAPIGALVSIGGKPAGKTPLKLQVSAYGKTTVRVSMAGYKEYESQVSPKPGNPAAITAILEKLPKTTPGKPATGTPARPGTILAPKPGTATPTKPGTATPTKPGTATPAKPATGTATKPATTAPRPR
jgi:hypothetical protein